MIPSLQDIICVGDATQLHYCRERYNYLMKELEEIELVISGKDYRNRSITEIVPRYAKMRAEMLNLDDLRTHIFLTAKSNTNEKS